MQTNECSDEEVDEAAAEFMAKYWPGWYCSYWRCGHYRMKDSDGDSWCWLRHGTGAEGRETECPAYKREMRLKAKTPNASGEQPAANETNKG